MNKHSTTLVRYYENGSAWGFTTYGGHIEGWGISPYTTKARPDWLETIVTAAKMGNHGVTPTHPPPDFILWFRFDPTTNQLISFGRD